MFLGKKTLVPGADPVGGPHALRPHNLLCMKGSYFLLFVYNLTKR